MAEGIFLAVNRKYGEIQFYDPKNQITEGYQRFWAFGTIKCYAESKGSII
ncbi:MAG: hypothetical protein QXJ85_03325 [Thermoplasmata archaeon]